MADQKLDPNGKYLIQDGSGTIYVWSEKLAARKDMRPYDPVSGTKAIDPVYAAEKRVPIEIQGKNFMVDPDLHAQLVEMSGVFQTIQIENESLKEKVRDFDAFRERLTTDNADLQEQLEAAKARIVELEAAAKPEAEEPKKGKK